MDYRLRQTWRFGSAFFAALVLGVLLDAVSELPTPRATMTTTDVQAEPPLPEEVYPESVRQQYLPERDWVLEGITETWKDVAVFDEDGNKIGTKRILVKEAWFMGRQGPYRAGDPLARTGFIIEEIFIDPENGESGVKLKGPGGARIERILPAPDRSALESDPDDNAAREERIEQLKRDWVLEEVTEAWFDVDILDDDGRVTGTERKLLKEAWFVGKRRPYRELDRLTNTRYQILKIIKHEDGTAEVALLGDAGERVRLHLSTDD